MKLPKYIKDNPDKEDLFQIHSQIANTIKKIIDDEDVTKQPFHFGLFGDWGSGKSLVIKQLKKQIKPTENVVLVELDVWKYVDSSLYRSILFDLEAELESQANSVSPNEILKKHFAQGFKDNKNRSLKEHLNFTNKVNLPTKEPTKIGKRLINLVCENWIALVVIFISGFLIYVTGFDSIKEDQHFLKFIHTYFKPLNDVFKIIGLFGGLTFTQEFFKKLFETASSKIETNVSLSSPTFAQDQFENLFRQMTFQASGNGKQKVVIVFDNIDRCEGELIYHILSGLKTFLSTPNCFFIIPCDDNALRNYWKETNTSEGYFDKIFTSYIRIPILESKKQLQFIEECIKESKVVLFEEDKQKIIQILFYAYGGDTPREILRFFNDLVSYYRLAYEIDPKEESILKNKAMFFFMMVIKQKWTHWERILIKKPNLFFELKVNKDIFQSVANDERKIKGVNGVDYELDFIDEKFIIFIDKCKSWIDFNVDVGQFVFFVKESNTSALNLFIISTLEEKFPLNQRLIDDIEEELKGNIKYTQYQNIFSDLIIKFTKLWDSSAEIGIKRHFTASYFRLLVYYNSKTKGTINLEHFDFIIANNIVNCIEVNNLNNSLEFVVKKLSELEYNESNKNYVIYFFNNLPPNYFKNYFFTDGTYLKKEYLLFVKPEIWKDYISSKYLNITENHISIELSELDLSVLRWLEKTDFNIQLKHFEAQFSVANLSSLILNESLKYYRILRNVNSNYYNNPIKQNIRTALMKSLARESANQNISANVFFSLLNFSDSIDNFRTIHPTTKENSSIWKTIIQNSTTYDWEICCQSEFKTQFVLEIISKSGNWIEFYNKVGSDFLKINFDRILEFTNTKQVAELLKVTMEWLLIDETDLSSFEIQTQIIEKISIEFIKLYITEIYYLELIIFDISNRIKFEKAVASLILDINWSKENIDLLKSPNLKEWLISKSYFKNKELKELLNEE